MMIKERGSLFSEDIHQQIYFFLLCLLALSMPTSRFLMSLSQILLGVNWILEGRYSEKWRRFLNCRPSHIFMIMYLAHIIGLLWSSDLSYGIGKDLKDKLPMLTLTFMVASARPLPVKKLHVMVYLFFSAALLASVVGFFIYIKGSYTNFRQIAPFISHIYTSMMICMTIVGLPWFTFRLTSDTRLRILSVIASLWLVVFLFILRSLTGLTCLGGIVFFLVVRIAFVPGYKWVRIATAFALLVVVSLSAFITYEIYNNVSKAYIPTAEELNERTSLGNNYNHFFDEHLRENGHYVYYFLAEEELKEAWNSRSELNYSGFDLRGNELRITLFRYMSSKGLRKDRDGLSKLSDEEIDAVEKGVPNIIFREMPGFLVRIHETIWEVYWYKFTNNPTDFSFAQRIELWKGSWIAFKEKPLLGWGTGDIFIAVRYGLEKMESKMENYYMKPHNQYLLFLLTLGIIGSVIIYGSYIVFIIKTHAYRFLPFNVFLVIMVVSMIGVNPIDAQAGQTFFSFFTLFFGIMYNRKG